jgi:hypothetical protein
MAILDLQAMTPEPTAPSGNKGKPRRSGASKSCGNCGGGDDGGGDDGGSGLSLLLC